MGYDTEYEVTETKQTGKPFALITYVIALVCLIVGLFLPLNGAQIDIGAMIGLQLPAAVNSLIKLDFLSQIAAQFPLLYGYELAIGETAINVGAILLILYALVVVCGIIALIPAIVSTVRNVNEKNIPLNAASFIEICAVVVLSVLTVFSLNDALATGTIADFGAYPLIIAFGGTFLMLALQAFRYKKGSGAVKFVLALISLITVLFVLFDITKILPFLSDAMAAVNSDSFGAGIVGGTSAMDYLAILVGAPLSQNAGEATLQIFIMATAYLTVINCVLDVMGLGKKTNFFMLVSNLVRYALEAVLAIVLIIIPLCIEGYALGLFAIVLAVCALISFFINLGRTLSYKKKAADEEDLFDGEENMFENETTERRVRTKEKAPAAPAVYAEKPEPVKPAEKPEQHPAESSKNSFYAPMIYYGPTDDFIRSLNNDLKIEFSRVFLERKSNPLTFIPDYVVGGKNDKFFNSVFIFYGRICDLVSDGLMNAIYKQANMMK